MRPSTASCIQAAGGPVRVTTSIGVALHDGHPDYSRVIDRADKTLYAAKAAGRNQVMVAGSSEAPEEEGV